MNIAPHRGEYREVICLKTKSIISVDYGNIEIFEGKTYRECLSGFGFLKENIYSRDCVLIEIGGHLWPFDKKYFATKSELRDIKLNKILE
jgi:hypothetical protein